MENEEVLLSYLRWALEDLGLLPAWEMLQPDFSGALRAQFDVVVTPTVNQHLFGRDFGRDVDAVLEQPIAFFRVSAPPDVPPSVEIERYQRMLAAFIASLLGNPDGFVRLGELLVTEPLNRKLSISYFLGNITGGRVGTLYKEIPSRDQVLEWAGIIRSRDLAPVVNLEQLAEYRGRRPEQ